MSVLRVNDVLLLDEPVKLLYHLLVIVLRSSAVIETSAVHCILIIFGIELRLRLCHFEVIGAFER